MAGMRDHGYMQKCCVVARIDVDKDNSMLTELELGEVVEVRVVGKVKELKAVEPDCPGSLVVEITTVRVKEVGEFDGVEDPD